METDAPKYDRISSVLRFTRDKRGDKNLKIQINEDRLLNHRLRHGLLINEYSTPVLENAVARVCERLEFPRENIVAFVYSSPNIQASCITTTEQKCIIQVSSSLANLLNENELVFIFGHELAHHLLKHWENSQDEASLESFVQKRAQEISVDRFGLYCCEGLKPAMTAIIKTVSGLDAAHLRFDVGQFISQLSLASKSGFYEDIKSSHPSFLFRAKALLLFHDERLFNIGQGEYEPYELEKKNQRIEKELDLLVEAPISDLKEILKRDFLMWSAMRLILMDGKINKTEQIKFEEQFGNEELQKFLRLVKNNRKSEVLRIINANLEKTEEQFKKAFPDFHNRHIEQMIENSNSQFAND